ncbi:hypothetical protein HY065_01760 [Candidatus Berkelbacteria bacterium]|nr:hypothetical protein [Candidatus Berkelbacteria bacterium]
MKLFLWLMIIIAVVIAAIVIYGSLVTKKTRRGPLQAKFVKGTLPKNLDGSYRGEAFGLLGSWQGKAIDAKTQTGINIFKEGKRYPFKFITARGRHDNIELMRIEYNIPGNPLWVRFIMDEMVEIGPNQYLGKIHARILPGFSVELGFFTLER